MHVYVHVPFCARRCSYCDFAIAVRREVPSAAYVEALLREWGHWQGHAIWRTSPDPQAAVVETLYFGGGTPSLLDPAGIARIVAQVAADRTISRDAEVTLEANPDDVTADAARAWRESGVTRVSLGAQSFDAGVLAWMHRTHTADQIAVAAERLRAAGIDRLSLDLIFGLPAALGRDWTADLSRARALDPDHLSLYGLTVEDHTPLARWTARGEVAPVDEERYAAEFLEADASLRDAGYEHYEVSNYARPGHRARHNSAYWRRAPFLGLGPSAHSAWGSTRRWNLREWSAYERAVGKGEVPTAGTEQLEPAAVALEELYLGLRTRDGIPLDRLASETVRSWTEAGWARVSAGNLVLTAEGWLRLDALTSAVS